MVDDASWQGEPPPRWLIMFVWTLCVAVVVACLLLGCRAKKPDKPAVIPLPESEGAGIRATIVLGPEAFPASWTMGLAATLDLSRGGLAPVFRGGPMAEYNAGVDLIAAGKLPTMDQPKLLTLMDRVRHAVEHPPDPARVDGLLPAIMPRAAGRQRGVLVWIILAEDEHVLTGTIRDANVLPEVGRWTIKLK